MVKFLLVTLCLQSLTFIKKNTFNNNRERERERERERKRMLAGGGEPDTHTHTHTLDEVGSYYTTEEHHRPKNIIVSLYLYIMTLKCKGLAGLIIPVKRPKIEI